MTETNSPSQTALARDGTPLAYELAGNGAGGGGKPRIVLIHSLALDSSVWRAVADDLSGDAEVLRYDCRGHGRSGKPAGPYSVEQFADDLADLLDAVGWPGVVVAGCSMGGCVAQAFAARYPDRVRGLVLVDTTDWYGEGAPGTWRERAAKARADGLAGMAAFQTTRWFGDAFRADHPETVKSMMDVFVANDIDAYAATCAMLGDADLRGALSSFDRPLSILVGEQDYATPPAMAEAMAARIGGGRVVPAILPGGRHLTPMELPRSVASAIRLVAVTESVGA